MTKFLTNPKFLPTVMVLLNIAASARYGFARDYRHMVYWIASAVLISAVTY